MHDECTFGNSNGYPWKLLATILINRPIVVAPLGVKLCRPSETVLDILPNPQRGPLAKEDGELVVDQHGNRVARPAQ
jgi:arsenate reductase